MKHKYSKLALWLFIGLFSCSWLLGALRFQWEFLSIAYSVINFPFGFLYLILEKNAVLVSAGWVHNEIISSIIWFTSILCQAAFYYYIIAIIRIYKQKQINRLPQ